ncbi:MAG TPA: LCP family protein [Mobilitalea sp.]|nr:LCP family protein [Mobilitalea sp.]
MQDNYDIDTDPDFDANFYKNIDKALSNVEFGGDPEIEAAANSDEQAKDALITEDINPGDGLEAYTQEDMAVGVDDELVDINASLAKQISEELMSMDNTSNTVKKKMSKKLKIQYGVVIALICLVSFAFFLGFTKPGNKILMKMGVDLGGKIWATWTKDFEKDPILIDDTDYLDEEDLSSEANEVDPSTIVWTDHPGDGMYMEGVYNILLLGEEAIGSGSARGRTDMIIIATLNSNAKEVKLTSLMRDTLVQIPGYKENKLNTAYEKGGLDLLYETIALNFDIKLDGCVMVNFENFEKIIDKIGGLEIELTSSEARYLNNTNYISNPQYRDVVEGKQLMNGNQVLGYTRVRKRANINGTNNDYGRTERHRIVLEAVFDKYKTNGKIELASMMLSILPMIKTDISSSNFELLLNTFIEMGTTKIDQLRIPVDGTFTDNVKVRKMDVLIPDLEKNVDILHEFIFGE